MGHRLAIRLSDELALWLEDMAKRSGLSRSAVIRAELQRARSRTKAKSFLRIAGSIDGLQDLSLRNGFSKHEHEA